MILFIIFIGLWLGLILRFHWITILILIILLGLFILYRFKKKLCLLFLVFACFGTAVSYINVDLDKTSYQGVVIESRENYYIFSNGLEKLYVKHIENPYQTGDILKIYGNKYDYDFPTLESSFDFNQYLKNKGVYHSFNVIKVEPLLLFPIRLKDYKYNFINKFSNETKGYIGSLYFGSGFYNEISDNLASLHLFRLSTLSGLSIFVILNIISYLISLKLDNEKAKNIAFVILIPYFVFTIRKFAIFKLIVLFLLKKINKKYFCPKLSYLSLLSLFGLACLLFDYHLAYQDKFNLSFLMSIVLYFYSNSFAFLKPNKKKICAAIFIFLIFIPFESIFYHEISFLSPLIQIILSPLIILISILTMLCFYGIPIFGAVDWLVNGLNMFANFIKPMFLTVYCKPFPLAFALCYETLLIISTYLYSIRFKPFYKVPIIFASLLGLYFVPVAPMYESYISFINIGQGDSTFIHYKRLDILIDTGGNLYKDIAKECLIPFFKKNQIYSLDYLITTHDDFDHIGAKDSLMKNFRVKNYLREPEQFPLIVGDFTMNNLNIYSRDSKDENENSLVLQFSLGKTDILVMGDAPINIENKILIDHPNIKCDILKVGHHGSNTSSSLQFVQRLDPDVAIISCGKNNKYGHPHAEVIDVLTFLKVEIRRTDIENTITYYF